MNRSLLTACSNKFFPGVILLISSIKKNYPGHPPIYVYNLGLTALFRKELESIPSVIVVPMPAFCSHWASCYTWKTYIFAHAPAELNLYIDSGFQLLRDPDSMFKEIEKTGYFTVSQNAPLSHIAPLEYKKLIKIEERFYEKEYITAGIFGFSKKSKEVNAVLDDLYNMGIAGLCLGFSPKEAWRNKGKNKNTLVRNCELFRFDTTLLSMLMRRDFFDFIPHPQEMYESHLLSDRPEQIFMNARLKILDKEYLRTKTLHNTYSLIAIVNHSYIRIFIALKSLYSKIKQ